MLSENKINKESRGATSKVFLGRDFEEYSRTSSIDGQIKLEDAKNNIFYRKNNSSSNSINFEGHDRLIM